MLIKNFGLFWRVDEIDWYPGQGEKNAFRLLGRQGKNLPGLKLADFRFQQGIYILYSNYGPYYTGLTTEQGLGKRLQDHLADKHAEKWDRFSWFGFKELCQKKNDSKLYPLKDLANIETGKTSIIIRDTEALLIRAMGLNNIAQTNFSQADEWVQVKEHEVEHYIGKIALT